MCIYNCIYICILLSQVRKQQAEEEMEWLHATSAEQKEGYDRRLRSLRQEHERVKGGYEAKIKVLEQQLLQASSSPSAAVTASGGVKGTKHSTTKPSTSAATTSKDIAATKSVGNTTNTVALQGRIK